MSALVDVLAVMDEAIVSMGMFKLGPDKLREARAAVAELIEAAKSVDALYPKHWDLTNGGAIIFPENVASFEAAFEKLSGALARIGSAE